MSRGARAWPYEVDGGLATLVTPMPVRRVDPLRSGTSAMIISAATDEVKLSRVDKTLYQITTRKPFVKGTTDQFFGNTRGRNDVEWRETDREDGGVRSKEFASKVTDERLLRDRSETSQTDDLVDLNR